MGNKNFPIEDGDVFVRRIRPHKKEPFGKPRPSRFFNANNETSVDLKRLLDGRVPPSFEDGEYLAEFPVELVLDSELTVNELEIEHTSGAHFNILGKFHIDFARHLKKVAKYVKVEESDEYSLP